jgi:hypothetical protein
MEQQSPAGGHPSREEMLVMYQVVAARRQNFDSMLWQVPALSLTAQAFLLVIALGSCGWEQIHRPAKDRVAAAGLRPRGLARRPSHRLWIAGLVLFGATGLAAALAAL